MRTYRRRVVGEHRQRALGGLGQNRSAPIEPFAQPRDLAPLVERPHAARAGVDDAQQHGVRADVDGGDLHFRIGDQTGVGGALDDLRLVLAVGRVTDAAATRREGEQAAAR